MAHMMLHDAIRPRSAWKSYRNNAAGRKCGAISRVGVMMACVEAHGIPADVLDGALCDYEDFLVERRRRMGILSDVDGYGGAREDATMGVSYLDDRPWAIWTREERFFCAVLYSHAAKDPRRFASCVIDTARLGVDPGGEWDLGLEVCFYRDYLWRKGLTTAKASDLPAKRTFDLCLFGERDIIIIEAKVCEPFGLRQNAVFANDRDMINDKLGLKHLGVHVVALASSRYFAGKVRPDTLVDFAGRLEWRQLAAEYGDDPLLGRADSMYGVARGAGFGD